MNKSPKKCYSLVNNVCYILKNLWVWDKTTIFFLMAQVPCSIAVSLLNLFLPKIVIEKMENNQPIEYVFLCIISFTCLLFLFNALLKFFGSKMEFHSILNHRQYILMVDKKAMSMDYETADSPRGRRLYQKAQNALYDKNRVASVLDTLMQLTINILGFFTYASIISTLNPMLVGLLLLTYIIDAVILLSVRKIEHKLKDKKAVSFRRIHRLVAKARDLELAKDIRMYNMFSWIEHISSVFIKDEYSIEKELAVKRFLSGLKSSILIFFRDGAVYAYLIYTLVNKNANASDVILYLNAIFGFSAWIVGIADYADKLLASSLFFCDIREYLGVDDKIQRQAIALPKKDKALKIEIENLSYVYPNGEKPVIKDLNLKIKEGEKIALVGANGSGKTTLVKLICGLYTPTKGSIKVNDKEISEYNREEYFSLFSVVFQDAKMLPVSIAENIAIENVDEIDKDKVKLCINKCGLENKINSLKNGVDTILGSTIKDEAINLSGGEMQKLMLARAIYKDAPIMILDEPTAALDPISERALYLQYNTLTCHKTSIYISHRLSSTKFCDRIILISDSKIVEEGTHDELMHLDGLYAKMFNSQSQYYK